MILKEIILGEDAFSEPFNYRKDGLLELKNNVLFR
jgi:hypothetical protein